VKKYPVDEMLQCARTFREELQRRRTIRTFSSRLVPREIIEACIYVAEKNIPHISKKSLDEMTPFAEKISWRF